MAHPRLCASRSSAGTAGRAMKPSRHGSALLSPPPLIGRERLKKRCLSDGGPRVRIHLPPAESLSHSRLRFRRSTKSGCRCITPISASAIHWNLAGSSTKASSRRICRKVPTELLHQRGCSMTALSASIAWRKPISLGYPLEPISVTTPPGRARDRRRRPMPAVRESDPKVISRHGALRIADAPETSESGAPNSLSDPVRCGVEQTGADPSLRACLGNRGQGRVDVFELAMSTSLNPSGRSVAQVTVGNRRKVRFSASAK